MRRLILTTLAATIATPLLFLAAAASPPTSTAPATRTNGSDASEVAAAPPALRGLFVAAARQFALPPALLVAIAQLESGFDPTAVGPPTPYGRAEGMMQFLPSSWALFNLTPGASPFDPGPAVLAAANHLLTSGALPRGGWDAAQALYGYNHSLDYVRAVLGLAARYGYDDNPTGPPLDPSRYHYPLATTTDATDSASLNAPPGTEELVCVRSELLAVTQADIRWTVTMRGEDGWLYHYADLATVDPRMRPGDIVEVGTAIGRTGPTRQGRPTAPFAISRGDSNDQPIDPTPYLAAWLQSIR